MALPRRSRGRSSLGRSRRQTSMAAIRASEEKALTMKAVSVPMAAIRMPPRAGPTARAMLKAMALSVTAAASSWIGTISRTAACQAGPLSAVPMPSAKVRRRRPAGPSRPRKPRRARQAAEAAVQTWATISTRRRSTMSAKAPATRAKRRIGASIAVWTRATMSGVPASVVISHAAPAPWISVPRAETRLAAQMTRNMPGRRRGARMPPPRRRSRPRPGHARHAAELAPRPRPGIAVAAVAGFTKAETERIWLFLVPFVCLAAAPAVRRPTLLVGVLAVQAVVYELLFDTLW